MIIESYEELDKYLDKENGYQAIVVEGYDGVGKGKLLTELSEKYRVKPYRPDYNLWQEFDHRKEDRWKVSGFFWDIYTHFKFIGIISQHAPMLFDRGVISGSVYNGDIRIAEAYKQILGDSSVLHIYVTCTPEDYASFLSIRNPEITAEEISKSISEFREYEQRYLRAFEVAGVPFIKYLNSYDPERADRVRYTCQGCGHYSYGWCRHPLCNTPVDANTVRCSNSTDREVQDYDTEMQCV